jgi:hypothetical protein
MTDDVSPYATENLPPGTVFPAEAAFDPILDGKSSFAPDLVAPCGIPCAICSGYLSFVSNSPINKCRGCRARNKQCAWLKKNCKDNRKLLKGDIEFCYECDSYPCDRLQRLDARYRRDFGMSMIDNLDFIRNKGVEAFIENQCRKYRCEKCGGLRSVHNGKCFACEKVRGWRE